MCACHEMLLKIWRKDIDLAKEGKRAGKTPEPFDAALDKYYAMRGWDKNGIPTEQTLRGLGLEAFV